MGLVPHRYARRLAGVLLWTTLLAHAGDWPADLPQRVELADVPFFAQDDYQCGPAALAMLLAHSGVAVTPQQLQPQVYLPGRAGSLAIELQAATRRQQRVPYLLPGRLDALLRELAAGQPVLVLLNPGFSWWPRWHYALAIGYDAVNEEMILHSGRERASHMQLTPFLNAWQRGGNWAMLALPAQRLPVFASAAAMLQQGIALEQAGQDQLAAPLYQAAVARWPEAHELWFGLGNVRYRLTQPAAAEAAWHTALQLKPVAAPARLNLIELLLEQRRKQEALVLLDGGEALEPGRIEYQALRRRLAVAD